MNDNNTAPAQPGEAFDDLGLTAVESAGDGSGSCCGGQGADSVEESTCGCSEHGYLSDKKRYLTRLRRIEGQIRGLHKMVDEEKYCIDILTQVTAVQSALRSLSLGLLDDHLHHCVLGAAEAGPEELDLKLEEASQAISRLVK